MSTYTDKSLDPGTDPAIGVILQKLLTSEYEMKIMHHAAYQKLKLWDYSKLAKVFKWARDEERKHACWVERRMLALGFDPTYNPATSPAVAPDVLGMLRAALAAEAKSIVDQNKAIVDLRVKNDDTSRRVVEHMLKDEEEHAEEFRAQLEQVAQMGLQGYLSTVA
ncbi:MAG TPA: ferritin-like domain-containing protein [Actinomycetes bacterium]|nr:ferritin-like domain-containing protein [Actinomycetes bacterium]